MIPYGYAARQRRVFTNVEEMCIITGMKICVINNLYPPYVRGGAEEVVVKTVQGLLGAGHEVVVITAAPSGRYRERDGRLSIYRYHPANIFFYTDAHKHGTPARMVWHAIDAFHVGAARYAGEALSAEKPDVVHTHNLMGISFLIPWIIRRLSIRHAHTVHDVQLAEPSGIILKARENSWRYTGWPIRAYAWIMRHLMSSPDIVISPSQFLLDFYERRGFFPRSRRVVLRNPAPESQSRAPREGAGRARFLYVGQIEAHKGVLFLAETFLSSGINAELHIVGGGTQLERVREMVKNCPRIVIHGKLERGNLPDIFRMADVLVVPSLCYENSPTVIFESFSFGVPVLASRVEGIAELIAEGENGMTFTTEDAASLREKLRWCAEHPGALQAMSQKIVRSKIGLSQKEYIERLLELYQKN